MFTGIVSVTGRICRIAGEAPRRLTIDAAGLAATRRNVGDSVAVAGVCLTVVAAAEGSFDAELSPETLRCTTLGGVATGARINLEPALAANEALGGHLVTGHVDGIARVLAVDESGGSLIARLEAPRDLARYLARKGSVALDGVSLTVGEVASAAFEVVVVPHTRAATTLGALTRGQVLNLEVDIVARYVERLLEARGAP